MKNRRTRSTVGQLKGISSAASRLLSATWMLVDAPFNAVTREIIGAAIDVHRALGPGLLESVYMQCLQYELSLRKLRFVTQRAVPIVYRGITLDARYRIDLIVEDVVIVEVKSVEQLAPVHRAQALTYMALLGCPGGLLINFNVAKLVDGVKRLVLTGDRGLQRNAERR